MAGDGIFARHRRWFVPQNIPLFEKALFPTWVGSEKRTSQRHSLLTGGERVARSSRRPHVNEPATGGQPDVLKKLSTDERRSSSKPRVRTGEGRPNAGAQLQRRIILRSALAAGENKGRGPGRENREAVVSLPAGRPFFEQWLALNRPLSVNEGKRNGTRRRDTTAVSRRVSPVSLLKTSRFF